MREPVRHGQFGIVAVVALLALAGRVEAQTEGVELSLLFAPEATYSSAEGLDTGTSWGLGAGVPLRSAWTLEARGLFSHQEASGISFERRTLDLGLRRSFAAGAGWRPFLQLGARQRATEIEREVVCLDSFQFPCPADREKRDEVGAFVGGGVDWRLAPRWALRLDGRLFLYESDLTGDFEEDTDLTLGLVFRF